MTCVKGQAKVCEFAQRHQCKSIQKAMTREIFVCLEIAKSRSIRLTLGSDFALSLFCRNAFLIFDWPGPMDSPRILLRLFTTTATVLWFRPSSQVYTHTCINHSKYWMHYTMSLKNINSPMAGACYDNP